MSFVKKTWKNRLSQYPNRRTLSAETGLTDVYTVSRAEGTVFEEGDKFDATNMNALEDRIFDAIDEISADSGELVPAYNTNISDFSTTYPCRYRKIGKTVEISGEISLSNGSTTETTRDLFVLPVGYRPSKRITGLATTHYGKKGSLIVYPDGKVQIARVPGDGYNSQDTMDKITWSALYIRFYV